MNILDSMSQALGSVFRWKAQPGEPKGAWLRLNAGSTGTYKGRRSLGEKKEGLGGDLHHQLLVARSFSSNPLWKRLVFAPSQMHVENFQVPALCLLPGC